ncbi:hypothetical protein evm_006677 [Chilo suppressalis]|nr:hypothetical protein evm_006677 [Chilo suppressalis]
MGRKMLSVLDLVIFLSGFFQAVSCQMMPLPFPGSPQMAFPRQMPFPGPMPGFMPPVMQPGFMPPGIPHPMPQPKLPVVVMPFYSKKKKDHVPRRHKKKRRIRKKYVSDSSSSSSDTDSSSIDLDLRTQRSRRSMGRNKQQVLTPVLSYVTKDGYVIYQKKIKEDRVKNWLQKGMRYSDETIGNNNRNRMAKDDLKKEISSKFSINTDYD